MAAAQVMVTIVSWNGKRYLSELLPSLEAQTYKDIQVLIIDNGSDDGTIEWLRATYPRIGVVKNARNIGFGPGHNLGIRYALDHWPGEPLEDRFVLVANQDIILTPTYIEEMVAAARAHPEAASFGGKLLRAFGENQHDEVMRETVKSDVIDTTGLAAHKDRTFSDRGAGEMDKGQYDQQQEVFGICAALCLYRASALVDARYNEEYFDHDFFAYKEDIDLAWRLRWLGWSARYVPTAIAYHYRGMYGKERMSWRERMKARRTRSPFRNALSTRNHWNMLMKNESCTNAMLALPFILFAELKRALYILVAEPRSLSASVQAVTRIPLMMRKRSVTFAKARVSRADMRTWFT